MFVLHVVTIGISHLYLMWQPFIDITNNVDLPWDAFDGLRVCGCVQPFRCSTSGLIQSTGALFGLSSALSIVAA